MVVIGGIIFFILFILVVLFVLYRIVYSKYKF